MNEGPFSGGPGANPSGTSWFSGHKADDPIESYQTGNDEEHDKPRVPIILASSCMGNPRNRYDCERSYYACGEQEGLPVRLERVAASDLRVPEGADVLLRLAGDEQHQADYREADRNDC